MKITDIVTRVVTKRSDKPLRNPRTTWWEKNALLVFVETDSGLTGIGEAWCEGSSPASTVALLKEDLRPLLVGEDPFFVSRIWERVFQTTVISAKRGIVLAALSGIDIALWDLIGKATRQPLYKLLGAYDDKVFAYASGGLYGEDKTPEALAAEMRGYVGHGFEGVKIKVGGAPLGMDVARVAAVREAIGPDVRLMVDAVYMLREHEALRMARAFAPYDVYFFEAPVSSYDVAGLAKVKALSPVPVAGNEIEFGRFAYRHIIESDAVSFLHLDAILCGGVSEAMRIVALAAAAHLPCSFHCSSSAVAFAANLHIAAAIPHCDSIEHHMVHRLLFERIPEDTFQLEGSFVRVPDRPGIGIELDLEGL